MKKLLIAALACWCSLSFCLCAEEKNDNIAMLSYKYKELVVKKYAWEKEHPHLMEMTAIGHPITMIDIRLDEKYHETILNMRVLEAMEGTEAEIDYLYIEAIGYFQAIHDILECYKSMH